MAAAVGAIASIAQGVMGFMQASYQAEVAKMNAKIANENAKRSIQRSSIEQEDFDRMETAATLGEQEAAQGASGLSISSPSAIKTRATSRALGRRDALNIIQAGQIEAYNYRTQAANFKAEAKASKLSGFSSLLGGFIGGVGSFANQPRTSLMASATPTVRRFPYPVPKPTGLVY